MLLGWQEGTGRVSEWVMRVRMVTETLRDSER